MRLCTANSPSHILGYLDCASRDFSFILFLISFFNFVLEKAGFKHVGKIPTISLKFFILHLL